MCRYLRLVIDVYKRQGQLQPCAGHLFFLCLGTDTPAIVLGQYALELHGDLIRPVLEDTPVLMRQDVAF